VTDRSGAMSRSEVYPELDRRKQWRVFLLVCWNYITCVDAESDESMLSYLLVLFTLNATGFFGTGGGGFFIPEGGGGEDELVGDDGFVSGDTGAIRPFGGGSSRSRDDCEVGAARGGIGGARRVAVLDETTR